MVNRAGIAATSASAIVFSILLLSNFAIYVASENRATLYSQADFENYLGSYAVSFAGASGANVLTGVQSFLSSQTFNCTSAPSVIAGEMGAMKDSQSTSYINETASAQEAPESAAPDNLSSLAPFNGSLPGVLDVSLDVTEKGGSSPTGVWFSKTETHYLHLPVRLDAAVAECVEAVEDVVDAVSTDPLSNCTSSQVASFIGPLASELSSAASADGFLFHLVYAVTSGTSCSVGFQVSIEQANIQGIGGSFEVQLEENGTATFAGPE